MKYISAVIVKNIITYDCAMIMSSWKQSLCCITAVLGRAFHPCHLKMAERQFDSTICNNSIRKQNDSVMRFDFLKSVIVMILHWKIVLTSLNSSFHSNPNSRCFVFVHFQSHNAPNLPPLHISETGYGVRKNVCNAKLYMAYARRSLE